MKTILTVLFMSLVFNMQAQTRKLTASCYDFSTSSVTFTATGYPVNSKIQLVNTITTFTENFLVTSDPFVFTSSTMSDPVIINWFTDFESGTRHDSDRLAVTVCSSLPVKTQDVSLINYKISWTTTTEVENSFFSIQGSEDGLKYKEIGQVKTLAVNGDSTTNLQYTFTIPIVSKLGFTGVGAVVLILFVLGMRRQRKLIPLALLVIVAGISCKKSLSEPDNTLYFKYYKIIQVGVDGKSMQVGSVLRSKE